MKKFISIICLMFLCGTVAAQERGFEKSIELNGGVGLDDCTNYTFGFNFIGGYRANKTFFIGAGLGYTYLDGLYYSSYEYRGLGNDSFNYDSYDARSNVQIFARAKVNLTQTKVSPFLLIDLGGTFGLTSNEIKMANGLTYEPALGVDININDAQTVYIMLGYKGLQYQYKSFNTTLGNSGEEIIKNMVGNFCLHLGFKF